MSSATVAHLQMELSGTLARLAIGPHWGSPECTRGNSGYFSAMVNEMTEILAQWNGLMRWMGGLMQIPVRIKLPVQIPPCRNPSTQECVETSKTFKNTKSCWRSKISLFPLQSHPPPRGQRHFEIKKRTSAKVTSPLWSFRSNCFSQTPPRKMLWDDLYFIIGVI